MNPIVSATSSVLLPVAPRVGRITTRVATGADLSFLDALQKQHSRALGFFPRAQMEGYVANQWVLIAEDATTKQPLGYCASRDRYLKRDELGVVYQLCVVPGEQRKLVGASLIKAVFERSAYGCRLYCCWCAQDLDANYFWESLGFVPIAFRAGSGKKKRAHIFWQRRITEEPTPFWYPCQTNAGAIREDRLVFPIPPGRHWSEVRAVVAPSDPVALPEPKNTAPRKRSEVRKPQQPTLSTTAAYRLRFGPPAPPVKPKPAKAARVKVKNDPKQVAVVRELRDRCLEHFNGDAAHDPLVLRAPVGKYDVSRTLASPASIALPLLKVG